MSKPMSIENTACFFGHRKIDATDELKTILYEEIEKLITVDGIDTFLFGSKSQFDDLCYKIVSALKEKYPDFKCDLTVDGFIDAYLKLKRGDK